MGNFVRFGVGDGGLVLLRPGLCGDGAAAAGGFLETVAVAVHGEDADVMVEPVEQRAGQLFRPEYGGPVFERQVRRDDGRAAFVALREGLEQQFGAGR